jgi:predicted XRE-type DNA-binding protein
MAEKKHKSRPAETDHEISSGNVFADLGLPHPEEALAKAKLAHQIGVLIDKAKLNQSQAARVLGVDQSKVSLIRRGRLEHFSIERLMKFLNAFDQEIVLTVRPVRRNQHAGVRVLVEA